VALVCARCGTQNPDSNKFCQACGTPLAAAPAPPAAPVGPTAASPFTQPPPPASSFPGPPAGAPPGPPAYASPYYSPTGAGPQPGVHRTPWILIIGVIVALLIVMGGVGTVLAVAMSSHNTQTTGFQSTVSSPSPAVSPKPGQSPSPSPSSLPNSGTTVSNAGETVTIPAGWTVLNKDSETITLQSPNGDGSITIGSGPSSPVQSAEQNKASMDAYFLQKFPDTKPCTGSKTSTGSLDGANGIFWELCFTLTSGAQSVQVGAPLWVGANGSGSVYYAALLETEASNMDNFIKEATPILDGGIKWNLT
jgi:zinc-ribbon domain